MRRMVIAGNWKMYTDKNEAYNLAKGIAEQVNNDSPVVILCPPAPLLQTVNEAINGSAVKLGAQNVHNEEKGAFTGEVTDQMLNSVGCDFVIIGHSERRKIFGETDEFINAKVKRTLEGPLTPILCIGEILEERESGKTNRKIEQQIKDGLADTVLTSGYGLLIAYEPVWAIGTGLTATPEQAEEVHSLIRKLLTEKYGEVISQDITIQYGGSVKPDNARELLSQQNIDGALVGGASLNIDSFISIIEAGN